MELVAMRKKKIIIHIGLPKCGSTSLQAYLARKADDMRVAGYDYPTSGAFYFLGSKNHLWLALSFGLQTPFFLTLSKQRRQLAKQHIKNAQESFSNYIDQSPGHTVVISDEHFADIASAPSLLRGLGEFLKQQFEEVSIVCYVRPYLDLIYSSFNQAVKVGKKTEPFDAFLRNKCQYFLLYPTLHNLAACFGQSNVFLRPLLRSELHEGSIHADFINLVCPDFKALNLREDAISANQSIPFDLAEIIRRLGFQISDDVTRNKLARNLVTARDDSSSTRCNPFSHDETTYLNRFFHEDAKRIEKTFLPAAQHGFLQNPSIILNPACTPVSRHAFNKAVNKLNRRGFNIIST